jgi:hypothetical protein
VRRDDQRRPACQARPGRADEDVSCSVPRAHPRSGTRESIALQFVSFKVTILTFGAAIVVGVLLASPLLLTRRLGAMDRDAGGTGEG